MERDETNSVNPEPEETINPTQKKFNLIHILIGFIILLVIVTGTSIAIYFSKSSPSSPTQPNPSPTPSTKKTNKDWQVYENKKYKYSIENFLQQSLREENTQDYDLLMINGGCVKIYAIPAKTLSVSDIDIEGIYTNINKFNELKINESIILDEKLQRNIIKGTYERKEDKTIGNYDWKVFGYRNNFENHGLKTRYLLQRNNITYVILTLAGGPCAISENDDSSSTWNQIISSFEFTDVDPKDTSKWKTYKNESLGIELKYPSGLYVLPDGFRKDLIFGLSKLSCEFPYQLSCATVDYLLIISHPTQEKSIESWIEKNLLTKDIYNKQVKDLLMSGKKCYELSHQENSYIGGLKAYSYSFSENQISHFGLCNDNEKFNSLGKIRKKVYLLHNGTVLEIIMDYDENYNLREKFNLIISTLKFTDSQTF